MFGFVGLFFVKLRGIGIDGMIVLWVFFIVFVVVGLFFDEFFDWGLGCVLYVLVGFVV